MCLVRDQIAAISSCFNESKDMSERLSQLGLDINLD